MQDQLLVGEGHKSLDSQTGRKNRRYVKYKIYQSGMSTVATENCVSFDLINSVHCELVYYVQYLQMYLIMYHYIIILLPQVSAYYMRSSESFAQRVKNTMDRNLLLYSVISASNCILLVRFI